MNGNYFNNIPEPLYNDNLIGNNSNNCVNNNLFFDNIIRLNNNKKVKVLLNNNEISGIIEQVGGDYIIISDPLTNKWHVISLGIIDYICFDEKINYNLPNK